MKEEIVRERERESKKKKNTPADPPSILHLPIILLSTYSTCSALLSSNNGTDRLSIYTLPT